jgi:hypothetical protein
VARDIWCIFPPAFGDSLGECRGQDMCSSDGRVCERCEEEGERYEERGEGLRQLEP